MKEIDINKIISIDLFAKYGTIALAKNEKEINGLTIGWGALGILWSLPICTVYVNEARYSKHIFDTARFYSVNLFDKDFNEQVKYYGTVSGRDEDKIKNGNLEVEYIDDVPYFKDAKYVIICEKVGQCPFDIESIYLDNIVEWYKKDGVHSSYFGKIIKVLEK